MTDLLAGLKLFMDFENQLRKINQLLKDREKMSKYNKTFYDVYCELWELLDKPRLKFWQRMRAKQLLNQLLRLHNTHFF